jgi:glutamine amidotransferase
MQTIAIINYGMGNVHSVKKALQYVAPNDNVIVTNISTDIDNADRIVFPGQGSMDGSIKALEKFNLIDTIKLNSANKPFLGICVGLQLLFDHSEENQGTKGLSIMSGKVVRFTNNNIKIPHMGWNVVKQVKNHYLWNNINDNSYFYSVHSYYVKENNSDIVFGKINYGIDFTAAIAKNNIFAVQFHPEKSKNDGLQLLTNFVNWKP